MTPELKTKWCNLLRSGEIDQARGSLKNSSGMCCLGVLAHIVKDDYPLPSEGTYLYTNYPPPPGGPDIFIEEYDTSINIHYKISNDLGIEYPTNMG